MLQNGSERPWEAKWLSVKGLLPFRFRYATVQNNGTRQTALGSHIFANWRRMALESKMALRARFASVPLPLCRSPE
jgi:hypothetical protein